MNQVYYKTSDINLASVLVTLGYELIKLVPTDSRRAEFIFRDEEGLQQSIKGYWDGSISPSALQLFNAQRNLKTRAKSEVSHVE